MRKIVFLMSILALFTVVITSCGSKRTANIEFQWKDVSESVIKHGAWGPRVYTMSNGELITG